MVSTPDEKAAAKAAKDAEKAAAKADVTSAAVHSATGGHIRSYTLADHGENFAELAKEFSDHTPGSTVH
jgi:hypothetical protein